jgi:hypothetical protein
VATRGDLRLFPELPALAIEPQMLRAIGWAGGPSDARTIAA